MEKEMNHFLQLLTKNGIDARYANGKHKPMDILLYKLSKRINLISDNDKEAIKRSIDKLADLRFKR